MKKVILCQHCGNENRMDLVCENKHEKSDVEWYYYNHVKVYRCTVCSQATITETDFFSEDYVPGDSPEEKIIFPPNEIAEEGPIPEEIIKAFKSSHRVVHLDNSIFLISVRRTLELICNDKKASGHNLRDKINDLAKKGILPESLRIASDFTRILGNTGAHSTQTVSKEVSLHLLKFVKYIIEYIYVLPEKLKEISDYKNMNL